MNFRYKSLAKKLASHTFDLQSALVIIIIAGGIIALPIEMHTKEAAVKRETPDKSHALSTDSNKPSTAATTTTPLTSSVPTKSTPAPASTSTKSCNTYEAEFGSLLESDESQQASKYNAAISPTPTTQSALGIANMQVSIINIGLNTDYSLYVNGITVAGCPVVASRPAPFPLLDSSILPPASTSPTTSPGTSTGSGISVTQAQHNCLVGGTAGSSAYQQCMKAYGY